MPTRDRASPLPLRTPTGKWKRPSSSWKPSTVTWPMRSRPPSQESKGKRTMDFHKINVKFFVETGNDIPLNSFIPVFHRWIQEDLLEGMLVDVAEYTHVYQGPGVLLIAHEANYSLDETDGKRGFLYAQKRTP